MLKYLSLAITEAIVLAPSFFLLYLSETNSAYAKLFVMIILANKYLKQYHDLNNKNPKE